MKRDLKEGETYEIVVGTEYTQDSFQRRNYKNIKCAYRILVGVNLLIDVLLLVFKGTGIIKDRYFYLIMAMIPLDLYLFSWIFHEVVSWGESKKEPDIRSYINIGYGKGIMIQYFLVLFFVLKPQIYRTQCIRGEKSIYVTTAVIFAFLLLVSLFTIRKQKGKIGKCMMIAWISLGFSWGLADAAIFATASHHAHYVTTVWDSTTTRNRSTYYRVKVLLKDGSMEWLETSEEVYDEVKDGGGVVVICEKTGIFDTEFVSVYLPK